MALYSKYVNIKTDRGYTYVYILRVASLSSLHICYVKLLSCIAVYHSPKYNFLNKSVYLYFTPVVT